MTDLKLHIHSDKNRNKSDDQGQSGCYQDNATLIRGSYDGKRRRLAWEQGR